VLVVEDEVKVAGLLRDHLEAEGYEVHAVGTGQAALAATAQDLPDLVILDLRLPDMSGYDVSKALRAQYNSWVLPILMLTAMDQPIDQLRGFGYGADAYLTKPFELRDVADTVAQLVGEPTSP
jgi:DNA-binding response OmpR family regulator